MTGASTLRCTQDLNSEVPAMHLHAFHHEGGLIHVILLAVQLLSLVFIEPLLLQHLHCTTNLSTGEDYALNSLVTTWSTRNRTKAHPNLVCTQCKVFC